MIIYRPLTQCVSQFVGGPLGSWGPRPGVGNLSLASQMWFFWSRHLARLIFSQHDCYGWNFFCNYPTKPSATPCSTRSRINSKKHVIKEKIQTFSIV